MKSIRCWGLGVRVLATLVPFALFAQFAVSQNQVRVYPPETQKSTPITIVVRQLSEITGERILLGDVADIKADTKTEDRLKHVFLGETPIIGLRRLITRESLITRLLAAGEKANGLTLVVPDGATAVRKGQTIASGPIVDAARAFARRQLGIDTDLIEKEPVREVPAPVGTIELAPVSMSDAGSTFSVFVSIRVGGKQVSTRTVRFAADLSQGVKQGQEVKLRLRSGGAVVELTGRAKSNAMVGQTVEVTTSLKTSHTGKVIAPGIVEVSL